MNELFGNSIPLQQVSLSFLWNKMQLHMNNVANANTPGYKTKFITFEEEFRNRLTMAHRQSATIKDYHDVIDSQKFTVHNTRNESARLDENNVNMDAEQVEIVRTSYQYNFLLKSINSDITRLRSAIKVGG